MQEYILQELLQKFKAIFTVITLVFDIIKLSWPLNGCIVCIHMETGHSNPITDEINKKSFSYKCLEISSGFEAAEGLKC